MNKYRTNIYLDNETANNLEKVSQKLHRSKNNTIVFLINHYIENEINNKNDFMEKWKPLNTNLNLDNVNIRDFAYDE